MKKSWYIAIGIILIMFVIICIFTFGKNESTKKENLQTTSQNVVKDENSKNTNELFENQINNTIENEVTTNEIVNENQNTVDSEIFEEKPETVEQKAVAIAKKDWGEDSNVEFSIDGINSNGSYIIAVRNTKTTEALAFYTVNVSDGTFTKKEMN